METDPYDGRCTNPEEWADPRAVAVFLKMTVSEVFSLVERGLLDSIGYGPNLLINKYSAINFQERRTAPAPEPASGSPDTETPSPAPAPSVSPSEREVLYRMVNRLQAQHAQDLRKLSTLNSQIEMLSREINQLELDKQQLLDQLDLINKSNKLNSPRRGQTGRLTTNLWQTSNAHSATG